MPPLSTYSINGFGSEGIEPNVACSDFLIAGAGIGWSGTGKGSGTERSGTERSGTTFPRRDRELSKISS